MTFQTNDPMLNLDNLIRQLAGVQPVRTKRTKTVLNADDLTAMALSRSTEKQRAKVEQMIKLGWNVSKVAGYDGKDALVFMKIKNPLGQTKLAVVKPDGDHDVNKAGTKTIRAELPR